MIASVLLLAAPLVAAKGVRRQATDVLEETGIDMATIASVTPLATGLNTDIATDLATGIDTELPLTTGSFDSGITKCVLPATITLPAGVPTLGPNGQQFAATVTDACQLFGSDLPSAVAADVAAYTSSLSVWASQNAAAISSYEQAANSFINAVKTDPVCASLYSTAQSVATDGQAACSAVNTAKSVAASKSAAGAAVTSGAAGSSGLRTTTAASGAGAATGAAASTSRPAGTGAGATIAPQNSVLLAGATLAITSVIGMILL